MDIIAGGRRHWTATRYTGHGCRARRGGLLTTALVALAVLWVLASIRFPDRPAMPGPVQPLLTQLTPGPSFDELASDIADLRARLEPLVLALPVDPPAGVTGGGRARRALPALRVRDDVAVVLLDATSVRQTGDEYSVIARDLASGLAIVRVPAAPTPRPVLWSPQQMDRPRYLIATDTSTDVVSWHPVFVGSMRPVASPAWAAEVWRLPAHAELGPGSFVFARDALLVGLVVDHGGERALVSGETLIAEADRLLAQAATLPAHVGIEVQAMTPSISRRPARPPAWWCPGWMHVGPRPARLTSATSSNRPMEPRCPPRSTGTPW